MCRMPSNVVLLSVGTFCLSCLLISCGGSKKLENAEVLLDLDKPDKAIEVLDDAVKDDPQSVEVHILRGQAYILAGDLEEAEGAFADAVAVGGMSAVREIDERLLAEYKSAFESAYLSRDPDEARKWPANLIVTGRTPTIMNGLRFVSEEDKKREALKWTISKLLDLEVQDGGLYGDIAVLAIGAFEDDRVFVDEQMFNAAVVLAGRSPKDKTSRSAAVFLAEYVVNKERAPEILSIVESNKTDAEHAEDTMAQLKQIGGAIEAYRKDNVEFPTVDDIDELWRQVVPYYLREVNKVDGWGNKLAAMSRRNHYVLISSGCDARFDLPYSAIDLSLDSLGKEQITNNLPAAGEQSGCEADVIYLDGSFFRWPKELPPN